MSNPADRLLLEARRASGEALRSARGAVIGSLAHSGAGVVDVRRVSASNRPPPVRAKRRVLGDLARARTEPRTVEKVARFVGPHRGLRRERYRDAAAASQRIGVSGRLQGRRGFPRGSR